MKTKFLCGLIAVSLLGPLVHASDVITFIGTTGLVSTGSLPTVLPVQGFNPGLGTLTEVKLTYWGEVQHVGTVENQNSNTSVLNPFSYSWSGSANLSLAKTAGGTALFATPAGTFSFILVGVITAPSDGIDDSGGPSGRTSPIIDLFWNAPAPYLDSNLAAYNSAGMLNFSALATSASSLDATPGGDLDGGVSTMASSWLKIDYTYTQIPEPSTYAVGLGLTALGFAAWRRRFGMAV